ncbi:hypothetical protein ACIHFD_14375 [Nonomuraea sp. NPDC051941]|uniref:hypothetical protein n=1 Tax=Nonomuraea sp. NPDC051941 TaxID=3364373 RepID=UPI0037C558A0
MYGRNLFLVAGTVTLFYVIVGSLEAGDTDMGRFVALALVGVGFMGGAIAMAIGVRKQIPHVPENVEARHDGDITA